MDDSTDDRTDAAGLEPTPTDPGQPWSGLSRGPRPPAEGVRIIGAEEAAAAIEAGQVSPRVPDTAPRFGDVPETPSEPRPPLRFPGADPASVSKPPVVAPDPPPVAHAPPFTPSVGRVPTAAPWPDFLGAETADAEPSPFWDPPAVATAPKGRFEELVTSQNDLPPLGPERPVEREGLGPEPDGGLQGRPVMPDRQVGPDRPLTSDPISGQWAVASGLGGGIDPPGSRRGPSTPEPAAEAVPDWDRLTAAGAVGSQGGGERAWDSFDDGDDLFGRSTSSAKATAAPVTEDSGPMSLPHWTEPATGEVPQILADIAPAQSAPDDELSAWSALSTGPRWRDQPADWDEADFHDTVLDDREARLGALRDEPAAQEDGDIFGFDDPVPVAPPTSAPPAPASPRARGGRGTATKTRPPARAPRAGPPRRGSSRGGALPGGEPPAGPPGKGGGSDLSTRLVTGLIAAGVVLAAAAIGPPALVVLVAAAVTMAAAELFQGLRARGYQPATLLGLVGCAAMVLAAYWRGEQAFPLVLSLMVVFSFLWYLAGVVRARPTQNIAVTLFAFVYVGYLGSFASLLLLFRVDGKRSVALLLGPVIAVAAHDIGAYLVGKYAGKTPLAPELSPNKTFEGLVGGILASVAVSMVVVGQLRPWDIGKAFWLGVVVAVVAPLGDLCESMIKRDLSLKDMGKLLPGHGGVLDRIDALLFVIPASYYLARILF